MLSREGCYLYDVLFMVVNMDGSHIICHDVGIDICIFAGLCSLLMKNNFLLLRVVLNLLLFYSLLTVVENPPYGFIYKAGRNHALRSKIYRTTLSGLQKILKNYTPRIRLPKMVAVSTSSNGDTG